MRRLLHKNREFWTHDRSITALLSYLSLSLFLWIPLSGKAWFEFLVRDVLFTLIVLAGIFSVLTKWRQQVVFIFMGIVAFTIRPLSQFFPNLRLEMPATITTVLFFTLLVWFVTRHIFKDGPVNFYRIQGSIIVYILMGMIWASLYDLLHQIDGGAFASAKATSLGPESFSQFLYFSFVTLTTLGYGDVVPVNPIAKSLVIFQGMFGMLYPVIMIARLVSMEVEHHRDARK